MHSTLPPLYVGVGWAIGYANWAKAKLLWHAGSTEVNHAVCHVIVEEDFAFCLATDIHYDGLNQQLNSLNVQLAELIREGRFDAP